MAELGASARGVAHDFSNLLFVIREQLAMAKEGLPAGHTSLESIDTAGEAIRQSEAIVEALALIARGATAPVESLDLGAAIEQSVHFIRKIAPDSVRIVSDVQVEPKVQVIGDAIGLHRVIVNLATNGIEAMPSGGTLTVSLSERPATLGGNEACIRVSDTGVGMSPAAMARIFEPFFTSRCDRSCGGLGLPVVREIVAAHGGRIDVHSDRGCGTCVSIIMPCERAMPLGAWRAGAGAYTRSSARVLVVGRDRRVRTRVNAALMSAGFRVAWAPSGSDALLALGRRGHDIASLVVDVDSTARVDLSLLADRHDWCGASGAVLLHNPPRPAAHARRAQRSCLLQKPFAPLELSSCVDRIVSAGTGGRVR